MSSFPMPVISATGISSPAFNDVQNFFIAQFQSIYGSDAVLTPDSQDGQWIAVISLAYYDLIQAIVATFNNQSPNFAQGAALSSLVKINGLQRQIPTNSTATVTIGGVTGTVINNGIVQDTSGNLWNLPATVIIPGSGSIQVTATAQVQGAISASPGTITGIYTPTFGWQTVTNAAAAVVGAPVETDAALRTRQSISTGQPALTSVQAIIATVANVPGVTRSQIYENSTNSTDSNGLPAHSISVVVLGGVLSAIALAIESKKSPGTGTFGTTTIVVNDPGGLPVPINFYQLTFVAIWVNITIHAHANFVATTGTTIVNNIVNFINNLPIGQAVLYNWLMSIAGIVDQAIGLSYNVTVLQVGTAPSPTGTTDVNIPFNQAASTVVANVILTVA